MFHKACLKARVGIGGSSASTCRPFDEGRRFLSDITAASLPPLTLVLGGQRSGKSAYAEALIGKGRGAIYLATGQALDGEMSARIALHRKRRGDHWTTLEEPLDLTGALKGIDRPVLIDSMAMWVANLLQEGRDVEAETLALVRALESIKSAVVIVSDEVGLGVIPENVLARDFIDALGLANQKIAAQAERVIMVTAGLAQVLKG
jgi:adenosylcobinamide kinase / adenosylcobinamide-phosphate guanylyltransferase